MELERFLMTGFDFDRWANRQWINALGGFKRLERAQAVLEHIHHAQKVWLERLNVMITPQQEDLTLKELFDITTRTWIAVVESSDLNEPIQYRTFSGEEYTQPIGHIALHVINHGTYHRGQLRELAETDGFMNFPETDLIRFLRGQSG